MACWADNYVGKPAARTLGRNCLGNVRGILRDVWRKPFPGQIAFTKHVMRSDGTVDMASLLETLEYADSLGACRLRRTKRAKDGTVVVCGNASNSVRHVGVYCAEADRVVHAVVDIPEPIVRGEPLWRMKHEWPLVSYFDVVRVPR